MKKGVLIALCALLFWSHHAVAQIGALPRPSEITRDLQNPMQGQTHPLRALQLIHKSNFFGFSGGVTEFGGAGQVSKSWLLREGVHSQLNTQMMYISSDNPYNDFNYGVSDNYTGNMMLIPVYFGVRRDIAYEMLSDAMLPYVQIGGGPILGLHFPHGYGFVNTFQKMTTAYTFGGYVGAGLDYDLSAKTVGFFDFRFNYIRFPGGFGGRENYSGVSIVFGISRTLPN